MNDRQARELSLGWDQIKILKRASTNAEITRRIWENCFLPCKEEKISTLINTEHVILKARFLKVKTATWRKNHLEVLEMKFFPCTRAAQHTAGLWDGLLSHSTCPWVGRQGIVVAQLPHAAASQDKAVGKPAKKASFFHLRVYLHWKITSY